MIYQGDQLFKICEARTDTTWGEIKNLYMTLEISPFNTSRWIFSLKIIKYITKILLKISALSQKHTT